MRRTPRVIAGFLIAPAIVPVIVGIFMAVMYAPEFGLARSVDLPADFDYQALRPDMFRWINNLTAWVAYIGMLLFGVPAYLLLRRFKRFTLTTTLVTGFIAGAVMWLSYKRLTAPICEPDPCGIDDMILYTGAVSPGGILGLIVAALFWFIARPDRTIGGMRDRPRREKHGVGHTIWQWSKNLWDFISGFG